MTRDIIRKAEIRERIKTEAPRLRDGSELLEIQTDMVSKDFQIVYEALVNLRLMNVCCVLVNPVEEPVGSHEILIANKSMLRSYPSSHLPEP